MPRRKPLIASAALSLLLGGLGAGAAQADSGSALYVDNNSAACSDSGPGSPAEPFCQIQPAADAAVPGTTVHVARGLVYQPVTIRSAGTADAPVTFVGEGAPVPVQGAGTTAVAFSGAQYVTMTGFSTLGSDASSLTFAGSHHVDFESGTVRATFPGGGSPLPVVTVDGTSSDISLARSSATLISGWALTSAAGARDITLADDVFQSTATGFGISAVGTAGLVMAGDTITAPCGNAISLTGGTSASVENTVLAVPVPGPKCASAGTGMLAVDAASAPQVSADYNALTSPVGGVDYSWAGTAHTTSAAFRAATGQGAHDLDQTDATLSPEVVEGSPLIDSGDSSAPGELATDRYGRARVDDPLVADTGTGGSHYDRGATEFQDPLGTPRLGGPRSVYRTQPTTFTADLSNPWSTPGLTYTFDFGDGATASSGSGSVTHTYTEEGSYAVRVSLAKADGTAVGSPSSYTLAVQPILPLSASIDCSADPAVPDAANCDFQTRTSYYPSTSGKITFGDGTAAVADTGESKLLTHAYAAPGTYTVTRTVTDAGGRTATATAKAVVGPSYLPLVSPQRVLDTRDGTGAAKAKLGPGGVVRVKVVGAGLVPSTGVTAVTMNVTDVNATSSSVVTAYADGAARPAASNLNFLAGQINPNLVTVPVSKDGYVDLYNLSGSVDLVADVEGYYYTTFPDTWSDQVLTNTAPVAPIRVLDTRNGTGAPAGAVGPGSTTTLALPWAEGVATTGVVLHVTVTAGTGSGVVKVYCGSDTPPLASNLNYRAGQTVSNLVATCVRNGTVEVYNSGASVQVIADLQGLNTNEFAGYPSQDISSPVGGAFVPTAPTRFLDTRSGVGAPAKPLGVDGTVAVKVAGVAGVPVGASAVLVNLTGTGPTASTVLIAYGGGSLPSVSNLNLVAGETRPALTMIPVDADGYIRIHNHAGTVNVVADLEGYFG